MRKTVVGTFDSREDAEQVAALLIERGFDRNDIDLRSTGATTGTSSSREKTSWWEWLFGESEDRSYYSERMDRGEAILAVTTDEDGAARARGLMEASGADVDAGAQPSRETGQAMREGAGPGEMTAGAFAGRQGSEEVLPVVEEYLRIGKRPVARGTVRVYSRVAERPVEERVPLREEHVRVERRPVDRPIGDAGAAFREDVIEIEETAEEVVVAKEARVVEEVVVSKDVDERVEDVRDRVRRTEIDVERTQGGTERAGASQGDDADFRRHWTETGRPRGLSYEQSEGAYRFGHELAEDAPGAGRDWSAVELEARRRWEERNPGTWGRFMDSIRYAWERAGRRRAA
jgi:uncharacterized protein (TIGR02271 family)